MDKAAVAHWQLPAEYRRKVLMRVQWLIAVGITIQLLMIIGGAYGRHTAILLLSALAILALSITLTFKRHFNVSAGIITGMILLLALSLALSGQGLHDIALLIFPANLVLGGLLLIRRHYWTLVGLTLLAVIILGVAEAQQWIHPTLQFIGVPRAIYEVLTLLVILSLIAMMVNMLVQGIAVYFAQTQQKSQMLERLSQQLQAEVDERRLAEKALQHLNSELEQRILDRTQELENSNRELESFSYSVSHDLRAPLRSVHGFASGIKDEYASQLGVDGLQMLERVLQASLRMDQLISDLLRFAQVSRQSLRDEVINTTELVQGVIDELREQQSSSAQFELGPLSPCRGDRALLRQVWLNLITNAIKFSRTQRHPLIEIRAEQHAERICFSVKDNGVGFDMQYRDKLFGVFHRLHAREQFDGTGIGLALSRRIVERHGGQMDAIGEVGKGATFTFCLPNAGEQRD